MIRMWRDLTDVVEADPPTTKEAQEVLHYLALRAKARFYVDENFPTSAVILLRSIGAQVRTANDAGLLGHPDENHAAYALRNGLVLLSCDRDFLDNGRFPLIHCPAIFVFQFGSGTRREIQQAFRCLAAVFRTPQFFDKWCKVDAKCDSWTEQVRHLNGLTSRTRYRLWHGKIQEWQE